MFANDSVLPSMAFVSRFQRTRTLSRYSRKAPSMSADRLANCRCRTPSAAGVMRSVAISWAAISIDASPHATAAGRDATHAAHSRQEPHRTPHVVTDSGLPRCPQAPHSERARCAPGTGQPATKPSAPDRVVSRSKPPRHTCSRRSATTPAKEKLSSTHLKLCRTSNPASFWAVRIFDIQSSTTSSKHA